jgi:hypothetical protein
MYFFAMCTTKRRLARMSALRAPSSERLWMRSFRSDAVNAAVGCRAA